MESEISLEAIQSVDALDEYAHLAARAHIALINENFDSKKFIGVGAKAGGKPIGLVLGWIESSRATLNSVFVSKDYRRQRVATRLLGLWEQRAVERNVAKLMASISVGSGSEPIRGVISKNNWLPPLRQRVLTATCGPEMRLGDAPWLKRNLDDDRLEVFPWHEVTPAEIETLRKVAASSDSWFPELLSPLIDNSNLHRPTSLGLRFNGEVIGWVITQQVAEGPIVFVTMFARAMPEYPLAGLKMFQDCARRLIEISKTESPVPLNCAIVDGNKFFEFMERRVFGYLPTETTELDVISKKCETAKGAVC